MSYSVTFKAPDIEGTDTFFLCNTSQWTRFSEWAPTVAIKAFAEKGTYKGTDALSAELELVKGQNGVADNLLDIIGVGDKEEMVTLES